MDLGDIVLLALGILLGFYIVAHFLLTGKAA